MQHAEKAESVPASKKEGATGLSLDAPQIIFLLAVVFMALGGGADISLTKRFAWRVQADYLHTDFYKQVQDNYRFQTGIVLRFTGGKKKRPYPEIQQDPIPPTQPPTTPPSTPQTEPTTPAPPPQEQTTPAPPQESTPPEEPPK